MKKLYFIVLEKTHVKLVFIAKTNIKFVDHEMDLRVLLQIPRKAHCSFGFSKVFNCYEFKQTHTNTIICGAHGRS